MRHVSSNVSYKRVDHICELITFTPTLHFKIEYNNLLLIKPLETILIRKPALLDMYEQYAIEIHIYYMYVVHVFVQFALRLQPHLQPHLQALHWTARALVLPEL